MLCHEITQPFFFGLFVCLFLLFYFMFSSSEAVSHVMSAFYLKQQQLRGASENRPFSSSPQSLFQREFKWEFLL